MTWQQKLIAWVAVAGIIGLAVLYVFEFKHFGNTLDFTDLAIKSLAVGLVVGGLSGWYFHKKTPLQEAAENMRRWSACLLLPLVLSPLLGSLTNRVLAFGPSYIKQVEFFEEKPYAASAYGFLEGEKISPDGWYLFVLIDGELVRFVGQKQRFTGANPGDLVELEVRKGVWGYEFLEQ